MTVVKTPHMVNHLILDIGLRPVSYNKITLII